MEKEPIVQGFDGYNLRFKWKPILSPSPCTYNTCSFPPKNVKPNKFAFNSTASRKPLYYPDTSDRPGVASYHAGNFERDRRIAFKYCFNSKKTMIPIVEFKCCPFKYDECNMCEEVPEGDYWELVDEDAEEPEYLCRPCMAKKKPSEIEGKVYKKVRNCSFMHIHQKTNNTIYLIEHKYWIKHQRKEAYFSRFYKD